MELSTFTEIAVSVAFLVFAALVLLQNRQTGKVLEALTTIVKAGADNPALLSAIDGLTASAPKALIDGLLSVLEGLETVTPPSGDELLNALEELIRRAKDNVDAEDDDETPPDGPAPDARPDPALN